MMFKLTASSCERPQRCSFYNWIFFSVPLDEKVPDGMQPRFWEEEGFYVGKPPQVSPSNLNIMENRIMDANEVCGFVVVVNNYNEIRGNSTLTQCLSIWFNQFSYFMSSCASVAFAILCMELFRLPAVSYFSFESQQIEGTPDGLAGSREERARKPDRRTPISPPFHP